MVEFSVSFAFEVQRFKRYLPVSCALAWGARGREFKSLRSDWRRSDLRSPSSVGPMVTRVPGADNARGPNFVFTVGRWIASLTKLGRRFERAGCVEKRSRFRFKPMKPIPNLNDLIFSRIRKRDRSVFDGCAADLFAAAEPLMWRKLWPAL